jgi:hypothetical protein
LVEVTGGTLSHAAAHRGSGVAHSWHATTIEVINDREKVLDQGRFGIDTVGYQAMLMLGRGHKDRVWAVEGRNGIGKHLAQRLVADGETVLDVPAKLSARVRVFDTGQGRKTDPVDAHSVAVAALRAKGLRQVAVDDATVALRLLADRRDGLGRARTDTINRLHQQLLELVPGGAKKFLSAPQARTCWPQSAPATSSGAPAGSSPANSSPNSPPSTRRSKPLTSSWSS